MKRIISTLRGRIVLAAALSSLLVLLGVGGLVLAGARRDAQTDLDRRLQNRATQIAKQPSVVATPPLAVAAGNPLTGLAIASDDIGVRVVLRGTLVGSAGTLPRSAADHLPSGAGTRTYRAAIGDRWRAATVQVAGRPRLLVEVSAPLSSLDGTVRALRRRIVLVGLLGLLVAVSLAVLAANYAVRSLGRLRIAAEEVSATDRLELRIPEDGPAEVHAVAHALNAMLARLDRSAAERERALQSTKQFAADAGHELRTPLAVLQTGLETLARNPDLPPGERQEIVEETLAEHRRLSDLVAALQALTRGDAGALGDEQAVEVADVVDAAVRAARRDHPTARFETSIDPATPTLVASPTGLRLLVDNLVQNAARHGVGAGGIATVHVTVRPAGLLGPGVGNASQSRGAVQLIVEDDGPGIPDTDRARITERFVRGATATGEGSGLGLAIAAQQARHLGSELTIGRSPAGGARFAATLHPLSPARPAPSPSNASEPAADRSA